MSQQHTGGGDTGVGLMLWDCCHGSRVHSDVSCGLRGDAGGVRHRRSKVGLRLGVRVACGAWARRSTNTGEVEEKEGRPSSTLWSQKQSDIEWRADRSVMIKREESASYY